MNSASDTMPASSAAVTPPAIERAAHDYGWTEDRRGPSARALWPILDGIMTGVPKDARVIDIGCGRGDYAISLADRGYRVVGVDSAASGIAIARRRCQTARFEAELADDGLLERLGEAPFDIAISTEVCEHVFDPFAWCRACYESIRPGGSLIASTPYHGYTKNLLTSLLNKWDKHWSPMWVGGHIKFWSPATLTKLLTRCGFVDVKIRYGGRVPLLWMTMVATARRPD